jgi:hypothetical protein
LLESAFARRLVSASPTTNDVEGSVMDTGTSFAWGRRLALAALLALGLAGPALAQSNLNPDLGKEWFDAGDQLRWPPNDGCAAPSVRITLAPGNEIDRYGSDFGRFFATPAVSWDARALPYDKTKMVYSVFVVQKPLEVEACAIAPWFGAPGLGVQFKTLDNVQTMLGAGVLSKK